MINRKNLSRLSVGCLIIGLATFGAIFVFGSRSPREQSCWDKTVEALKRQQSILAEMQASVEHQLRDPSSLPPPGERHVRQERLARRGKVRRVSKLEFHGSLHLGQD